jgi:hypothetical protein
MFTFYSHINIHVYISETKAASRSLFGRRAAAIPRNIGCLTGVGTFARFQTRVELLSYDSHNIFCMTLGYPGQNS